MKILLIILKIEITYVNLSSEIKQRYIEIFEKILFNFMKSRNTVLSF